MTSGRTSWGLAAFLASGVVAFALGAIVGAGLSRAPEFIPCAVPVWAVQATTLEELEDRAALKMAAMRRCGELIEEKRNAN